MVKKGEKILAWSSWEIPGPSSLRPLPVFSIFGCLDSVWTCPYTGLMGSNFESLVRSYSLQFPRSYRGLATQTRESSAHEINILDFVLATRQQVLKVGKYKVYQ